MKMTNMPKPRRRFLQFTLVFFLSYLPATSTLLNGGGGFGGGAGGNGGGDSGRR
ncbi:hypothetical protein Hanom_Chr04g00381311 [Helianthus anomalus]